MKRALFLLILITILNSCSNLNQYERNMIGGYSVVEVNPRTCDSTFKISSFKLAIKEDKTFILQTNKQAIAGKWNADDFGDWTIINFEVEKKSCSGRILGKDGEIIQMNTPFFVECDELKDFSFKRVDSKGDKK